MAIGWNAIVSISDWKGLTESYNLKGFQQYRKLLNDPIFWISLKNNLFLFLFIPCSIGLGLFLAMMLDQKIRGEGVFRNIYLLPFALSFVVTATLWAWMYAPSNGVLNSLLRSLGLGSLASRWHTSESTVMWSILIAFLWQFSGYAMIILLAGMKSIPESQLWAARLDGASGFGLYRRVVIPQLKFSFLSAFVILMLYALKAFDFIWVLTSGGPGYSSYVLPVMMYKKTFESMRFAYGSAIANMLLAIVLVIVVPYLYWSYRRK
jgi:glucose/mannose transport system permease protein